VRLYGEKSVAEGERPYTHEDLDRDSDNSCDNGSSAIRIDRIRVTIDDNARLRALIKTAEWDGNYEGAACCPWCERNWAPPRGAKHDDECSAFTPSGEVR